MGKTRIGPLFAGLVLVLAACGRVASPTSENGSPSPVESAAPTAEASPLTIPGPTFPTAEVGLTYAPVTLQASGGSPPYTWRVSDGALPDGLDMMPDGVVSGTPNAAGRFDFTLEVMDAGTATASIAGSINVASQLAFRYINHAYNAQTGYPIMNVCVMARADHPCPNPDDRALQAAAVSGGVGPYTYALASGLLPPMSSLNAVGLSWQAASYQQGQLPMGDFPIKIRVTDSAGASVMVGVEYWLYRM